MGQKGACAFVFLLEWGREERDGGKKEQDDEFHETC